MDIKHKINNLDKLNNKELVELVEFYLNLVNKAFSEAEGCKRCSESCCDIFNNNYCQIKNALSKISNEKKLNELDKEECKTVKINKIESSGINNNLDKDYLASVEFSNFEKKYK